MRVGASLHLTTLIGGGWSSRTWRLTWTLVSQSFDVDSSHKKLVTVYIRWLVIALRDQFGLLIGDVHENVNLGGGSNTDPVGIPIGSTVVDAKDTPTIHNSVSGSTKNPLPSV
jgi:hypothetical protein